MIQGKNIYFRAIEENDFEFIVKARNLLKVNKYFYEHELFFTNAKRLV
jgi:hypothetical protein